MEVFHLLLSRQETTALGKDTKYETKSNDQFEGRFMAWTLITSYNGQELNTRPQTSSLLRVRVKQWLKGQQNLFLYVKYFRSAAEHLETKLQPLQLIQTSNYLSF